MGVHVMGVKATIDMLAATGDDRNMQKVLVVGESRAGVAAIADKNGIFSDDRL